MVEAPFILYVPMTCDIYTIGHLNLIHRAVTIITHNTRKTNILVYALLHTDQTAQIIRDGIPPINSFENRLHVVSHIKYFSRVIPLDIKTSCHRHEYVDGIINIILQYTPCDRIFIIHGDDWLSTDQHRFMNFKMRHILLEKIKYLRNISLLELKYSRIDQIDWISHYLNRICYEQFSESVVDYNFRPLSEVILQGISRTSIDGSVEIVDEILKCFLPEISISGRELVKHYWHGYSGYYIPCSPQNSRENDTDKIIAVLPMAADVFHHGHVNIIEFALDHLKKMTTKLIIALHSDDSLKSYKRNPIFSFSSRSQLLSSISGVSEVYCLEALTPHDYVYEIFSLAPDFIFHGNDWIGSPFRNGIVERIEKTGLKCQLIEPDYTEGVSSTSLISRLNLDS